MLGLNLNNWKQTRMQFESKHKMLFPEHRVRPMVQSLGTWFAEYQDRNFAGKLLRSYWRSTTHNVLLCLGACCFKVETTNFEEAPMRSLGLLMGKLQQTLYVKNSLHPLDVDYSVFYVANWHIPCLCWKQNAVRWFNLKIDYERNVLLLNFNS